MPSIETLIHDVQERNATAGGMAVGTAMVIAPLGATVGAAAGGIANMVANHKSRDRVDDGHKDAGKKHESSHHYIAECAAIGGGVGVIAPAALIAFGVRKMNADDLRRVAAARSSPHAAEEHV